MRGLDPGSIPGMGASQFFLPTWSTSLLFCWKQKIARDCFLPALGSFLVLAYPWKSVFRRYETGIIRMHHHKNIVRPRPAAFT